MMEFFGELAWRERKEEWSALQTIQGATGRDVLRINDLPIGWKVTDKDSKEVTISADYIMSKATLKKCAKFLKIELMTICDLTGKSAKELHSGYPKWLYEASLKKELFHLMDDKQLEEVQRVVEIAIRRQIVFNKFEIQRSMGRQSFVAGDKMFVLVGKILLENAIMKAAARGSQAVIEQRLKPLLNLCNDLTVTDADFRARLSGILTELQSHLHEELPKVFHDELQEWTKRLLRPYVDEEKRKLMSEEDEESEDE